MLTKGVVLTLSAGIIRYKLRDDPFLSEVFETGFLHKLEELIHRAGPAGRVFSAPDEIIRAGSVVLSGARIIFDGADNGLELIMIRFKRVLGEVGDLFTGQAAPNLHAPQAAPASQALTYEHLCLPILNFAAYLETELADNSDTLPPETRTVIRRLHQAIDLARHDFDRLDYEIKRSAISSAA